MKIKDADINDSLAVFEWLNDPISCQMSTSNKKVSLEDHKKWFEASLMNPLRKIYIGVLIDQRVGVCRFDMDAKMTTAEVSINLNPIMRRKNFSYEFLRESIDAYTKFKKIKLTATIKIENKASLIIFQKCHFSIIKQNSFYCYLAID